ncbi:MAG: pyridoxal phosphate-dependent aminotransferase [Sulfolobales archaeon]|nr:pyridoxal phosphate-dependent aminotransferase [Sulfolobales archaeon]MDW8082177.1 pyridoxal phosphate-dependent aminotransferase [Sulfolobales archaeon]
MKPSTLDMKPIIAELLGEVAFVYIAKARELERAGHRVISFGVGQPDIPTFQHIIDEAKKALDSKFTGYTETPGIRELREAVADYLNGRYGSNVKPSEIIITPGAKGAIFLALSAYINPGDEIIVPEPSYPAYPEVARFLGAKPVYIPLKWLGPTGGFALDVEAIEAAITPRTKAVVVNNPHNPTGALFTPTQVERIYEIAREHNIMVLVDEIYDNFIYDNQPFRSFLTFSDWRDRVLYINGFSKTFSMTGWRLGYLVVREEVASKLTRLAVNIWSCPVSFAQRAAIAALRGPWEPVKEMIRLFQYRRDVITRKLSEIRGFEVWPSTGAFYIFPRIKKVLDAAKLTVEEFVEKLLYSKYVVTLPGTAFPDKAGREYIRLSFAVDAKLIEEGVERIKEFIGSLGI